MTVNDPLENKDLMEFVLAKGESMGHSEEGGLRRVTTHPHPYKCFCDNHSIYCMIFIITPTLLLLKSKSFLFAKKTVTISSHTTNLIDQE